MDRCVEVGGNNQDEAEDCCNVHDDGVGVDISSDEH